MIDNLKELALDFIQHYIPFCNTAIVTGSSATNERLKNADIDLLILDENTSSGYFETMYFKGFKFDCILLPSVNIWKTLLAERNNNNICYIDMINKGVILRDNLNLLPDLKKFTSNLKKVGPKPIEIHNRKTLIYQAYKLLEDLEDEREWNETLFIALDLFQMIIYINSKLQNDWTVTSGKWKYRYLLQANKDFALTISDKLTEFIHDKDKSDFYDFAKRRLESFGEKPKHYSARLYSSTITDEVLTISTNTIAKTKDISEILFKQLNNQLKPYSNSVQTFHIKNDGYINDQSDYLTFILGENDILESTIAPLVNRFLGEKRSTLEEYGISSHLNYHLKPADLFINQKMLEMLKPILFHFYTIYDWIGSYDLDKILAYILQFHLYLGEKLGFTLSSFSDLNGFLFERWLPFVINKSSGVKFSDLEQEKTSRIKKYQSLFDSLEKDYHNNYIDIFEKWGKLRLDFLDIYIAKGVNLFLEFYDNLDTGFLETLQVPQFLLNQIKSDTSDYEKIKWIVLNEALNLLYSSVLLSAEQKSFLAFSCFSMQKFLKDNSHQ